MSGLHIRPRFLFLSADPALVRAQLAGMPATLAAALPLRDEVSTDEILPPPAMVHFDATLGRHPYTGFEAGGERPVARDAVREARIEVVVAGLRYGKGSSREHSVVAELSAGVRLVIARSFERIYGQNADNVGLLTSTDFGLITRIARGEALTLDELLAGRDALAADIVRSGGLLRHGQVHLRAHQRALGPAPLRPATRPQSLFEKIVQRHALGAPLQPGQGGFVRADWRFIHEYYTGIARICWTRRWAQAGPCTNRRASSPSRTTCPTCTAAPCTWPRGWWAACSACRARTAPLSNAMACCTTATCRRRTRVIRATPARWASRTR